MGLQDLIEDFIDSVPDEKLRALRAAGRTIKKDANLRLDMQAITHDGRYNLQVQVNNKPKHTSLREFAPNSVTGAVLVQEGAEPSDIKEALKGSIDLNAGRNERPSVNVDRRVVEEEEVDENASTREWAMRNQDDAEPIEVRNLDAIGADGFL
ncbi:hypothetical protein BGZ61DRAFT_538856 [Ilyonectria robusta]|uniref:uncharacterized protein n=1 Tax=Ilyonectria robusta TaxID=1079257 RepID=UPI001E8D2622|nr:uncharacterized protein BGZ61DRAFT_538856 [Ilyonectria robusta]KAH8664770.1 hypothetical protein BGZ61DRAFT_538856 [Ilyonectria robusta]